MNRHATLEALKTKSFDLLVIGGGASGSGIALDAAQRGLKTAIVERFDFASGTSSKSTKLLHGGVRYLEKAVYNLDVKQYHLVKEALKERSLIFQNAPFLAKPLELIIPLYHLWEIPYYWAGIKFYDWVAASSSLPKSSYISPKQVIQKIPAIKTKGLVGGISYFDGQFNDARLNISLVLTAIKGGAKALNYAEVIALGKKTARVVDHITGETFEISAKTIINAAGPYVDGVRLLDDPSAVPLIAPSSGTHILIESSHMHAESGLLVPKTKDGRVIFILPWEGSLLIGTTDTPQFSLKDIDYLLTYANQYLNINLDARSIKSIWSGVRPLVKDTSSKTENIVREHFIETSPSGLITITGGKWTTYRKMAEDVMQLVYPSSSSTENLALIGAEGYSKTLPDELMEQFRITAEAARHLVSSYGGRAKVLLEKGFLNAPLVENHPVLHSEIQWAIAEEMAEKPMDILARRTSLALLDAQAAEKALPKVIKTMQAHLGWTPEKASQEEEEALNQLRQMYPNSPSAPENRFQTGRHVRF
jgi:glycerol-3-phosphate dehydrogenase